MCATKPIVLCERRFWQKTCGIKSYQETFVICRCKCDVFFFFWEHLFPQAPPEPEEDGLDDEQREVDMEKDWTCGYWRYGSVDLRFLCRALDSELPSEKVPSSFSLHFQEIKRRRSFIRCRDSVDSDNIADCRMDHQPHMIQHWKESNGIPIGVLFQLGLIRWYMAVLPVPHNGPVQWTRLSWIQLCVPTL